MNFPFSYEDEDGSITLVTGFAPWNSQYVEVTVSDSKRSYRSVRVTSQVRTRMAAEGHSCAL